jgi:pilus assembly protein CpaB
MSPRRIIFIAVALLVSGLTMWVGRSYLEAQRQAALDAQRQQPVPQQPATMVLVAKGNLAAGQFVRPENLRWQPWPTDGIAASYIVQGQRQLEEFLGAVVRSGVGDGEPITETRLVRKSDRGFLASVLEPGSRAVTVNLTPSSGISGFLFPGDHVDMILTLTVQSEERGGGKHENRASETVLSDVRVLAIDQRADDQNKDIVVAKTATLEVTRKQAEVVAVISAIGQISLSLRSLARDEAEAAAEAGSQKLSYTFDSEATKLIRPPGGGSGDGKIEVIRGTKPSKAGGLK